MNALGFGSNADGYPRVELWARYADVDRVCHNSGYQIITEVTLHGLSGMSYVTKKHWKGQQYANRRHERCPDNKSLNDDTS